MGYTVLANLVVIAHVAFVVFVMLGGLLVWRWRWLLVLHLPAVIWGFLVEINHWICPLTPLELSLRRAAHEAGYSGGFLEHYLLSLLYPTYLTPAIQWGFAALVVAVNLALYITMLARRR